MEHHAKYSPSQLYRIIACPGSVTMCEDEPNETSSYAEEGTMLHEVMEKSLNTSSFHTPVILPSNLTKEQTRACEQAADYLQEVYREIRLEDIILSHTEMKTSLAYVNLVDCYGTADIVIKTKRTLHVMDWKFGRGVEVYVKDNPQFMAYAMGAVESIKELMSYDKIVTHVVQPRLDNMFSYEYTPQQLILWCEETLRPALQSAENQGPCHPGEKQCKWCLAKYKCRSRYELAQTTAQEVFAMYKQPTVDKTELARLFKDIKFLEKYIKDLKVFALDECVAGKGFPGHKVVCGRTTRSWSDEKIAREFLLARSDDPQAGFTFEDLFESKFLSPPKAEKLVKSFKKDKDFQELITKTPGKPTLVPDSDPRAEYTMDATSAFAGYAV